MPRSPRPAPGRFARRIAARLRHRAIEIGMSQSVLGDAVGISQQQVSKIFLGERPIDVDQLDAACYALGLDIAEVVRAAAASDDDDVKARRPGAL